MTGKCWSCRLGAFLVHMTWSACIVTENFISQNRLEKLGFVYGELSFLESVYLYFVCVKGEMNELHFQTVICLQKFKVVLNNDSNTLQIFI